MHEQLTQLAAAIRENDVTAVKVMLTAWPELAEQSDQNGVPLPFLAAATGSLELVSYLVEYSRASMNAVDAQGRTILHYAAVSGSLPLCQYLVERVGMDLCDGDAAQMTPFELAVKSGHQKVIRYFEQKTGCSYHQMYRNPIRAGMYPDPSIVRVGTDYYMVNSSFVFFPCIPVSHSTDLVNWEIIGHAITNPEWSMLGELDGGRGYWAPDISYDDGLFYITATYRLNDGGEVVRRQMVVTATRPEGPYSRPVFLDEDGIDPSIFHEDGKHYMLLNRGARIFEIDKMGTKIISRPELLYYGHQKRAPEGPHLLKRGGYYYLFLAEGGTGPGHRISVARSKTLKGIYQPCPYNPIMRQQNPQAGMQRCGHGKPVCTQNGEWYMVYLCGRMVDGTYSMLGRETALDPIEWTADGWPIVNRLKGPSVLQKRPDLPLMETTDTQLDNRLIPLSKEWMFPREPEPDAVQDQGDWMLLKASRYPLFDIRSRNVLVRRQTAFCFEAGVTIGLTGLEPGQQSGIMGYYDENSWICFGIKKNQNGYQLCLTEQIGHEQVTHQAVALKPNCTETIELVMATKGLKRCFSYCGENGISQPVYQLENVFYLSDEGVSFGKRFTGAMVGLYSIADEPDPFYGAFQHFWYQRMDGE